MLSPERTAFFGIRRGEKSKKYCFGCVPLRVPPLSQKASHGWWERTVIYNKSEKNYYVYVHHSSSATQGWAEETVTSLCSGQGGSRSPHLLAGSLGRERLGGWFCCTLYDGCIRMLMLQLSETCGKDGIFPFLCFLWLESETKSEMLLFTFLCSWRFSIPWLQGSRGACAFV